MPVFRCADTGLWASAQAHAPNTYLPTIIRWKRTFLTLEAFVACCEFISQEFIVVYMFEENMGIFINSFASKCSYYETDEDCTVNALLDYIANTKGYPSDIVKVVYNGYYVDGHQIIRNNSTVHIVLSLCGGKGGFGSMLRAIGAQIEKTTNREACRDLSGRRLRDINEEQRLKRWIAKKAERERVAAERRRQKLEQMCSLPKHEFHDAQYDRERRDLTERIDDSLTHGLKVATGKKRKMESDMPSPKKKSCLWIGVNVDENEQSSEDADSPDENISSIEDVSRGSNMDEVNEECKIANDDDSSSSIHSDSCSPTIQDNISECTSNEGNKENVGSSSRHSDSCSLTIQDNVSESISNEGNKENSLILEVPVSALEESSKTETENSIDAEPLDLLSFQSQKELESLGLDRLKSALQHLGMKCGGTLQQRAERLWLVRGVDPSEISPSLLAKPAKGKK